MLRKNNNLKDYGIIRDIPSPEDILYQLEYDTERGFLLLNRIPIQRFQWEGTSDKVFTELFKADGDVKQIELQDLDANTIINNIKMPLSFRKAIFRTSDNGKKIQITTKITRARLKQFRSGIGVIDDYILKKRDAFYKTEKD